MDQVISMSNGKNITESDIFQMSSISGGSDYAFEILDNITSGNIEKSLEIGAEVLRSGYGSKILISNMIDLISQTMESICTKKHDPKTQKLCVNLDKTGNLSIQVLDRLYQVLAQSLAFIDTIEEKSVLDTLIIRLSFINKAPTLEEIVASLVNN
jgi:DNA polymerase III gamma/tau subunit